MMFFVINPVFIRAYENFNLNFYPFYSARRGSGGSAKKSIIHLVALADCEPWRTRCVVRLMNLVFLPTVNNSLFINNFFDINS